MNVERVERHTSRGRSGPAFPGPLLLLFPLLFLAGGIAFLQSRKPARLAPPAPPAAEEPASVEGWAGRGGVRAGELSARLRPLHEDQTRQAFDAESLSRRLSLEPGQPWSLELTWRTEGEGGAPFELADLSVRDRAGEASRPLSRVEPVAATAVADPLAVLLSPLPALHPGRTVRLVLWGREPRDGAELGGSFGTVSLRRERFAIPDRPVATARLERAQADQAHAGGDASEEEE